MNKNNFVLMAALYDTEGAGLYQDIYFPIVRYALTVMHSTQRELERYYDLGNLQQSVLTKFGITMPLTVLKQCVRALGNNSNGLVLTIYENGVHFLIKQVGDVNIKSEIDSRLSEIERDFDRLESEFQAYLKDNVVDSSDTFLSFVRDNSADIYQYFDDGGASLKINEDYYHVVRFLRIIKEVDIDLFTVANNIFWGSMIAGFLRREREINIKPTEKVQYYLDTSLVLAALDLDSEENVAYAKELLDIIHSAGSSVYLHGFTLKEIDSILYSVERSQKPLPNSSIEKAYSRRNLTPSKLLKIRTELPKLISELGIFIEPSLTEKQSLEIIYQYKNNSNVKELKIERAEYEESQASIHDVSMIDFVKKKRGNIVSPEHVNCSFVSLNTGLIQFAKDRYSGVKFPYVIHPSKITMDLWLHSSKLLDFKMTALPEAMSRCIALNNTDVRHKLGIVARYSKDATHSREEYIALELALINRSRAVLAEVDAMQSDDETKSPEEHIRRLVKLAVDEEMKRRDTIAIAQRTAQSTKNNSDAIVASFQQESAKKDESIARKDIQIINLTRMSEINETVSTKQEELSSLKRDMDNSIIMIKYWLIISAEIIGALFILYGVVNIIVTFMKEPSFSNFDITISVATGIAIILGIARCQNLYILSPKISRQKHRDEQIKHWMSNNPQYAQLDNDINTLKSEKKSLTSNLKP